MEAVLQQINKNQGVVGSLVCNDEGALVCHQLPASIETGILQEASAIISDSIIGLKQTIGDLGLLDLRYSDGRLLVKPLHKGYLLLLCDPKINLQLLNMTLDVALKKLEKSFSGQQTGPQGAMPAPATSTQTPPNAIHELRREGKGIALVVDSMKASSKIQWDQMKEDAAVGKVLAQDLCRLFNVENLKKIRLVNKTSEKSKVFHLIIYDRGDGQTFDNKICLTLAASEALMAKPGDEVVAEPAGGGLFG